MEMFSPNPARSLTAGRIPYALGGGMLGDTGVEVFGNGLRLTDNNPVEFGTYYGQAKIVHETPDPVGLGFYVGSDRRLKITNSGNLLFGPQSELANGKAQLPVHTTPGGGVGFYDFSLYRAGAQLAGLNASLSLSGQCVPGYGSFALPALVPGDSGNGLYCEDPGGGRVLYFKGYGGRSAFRKSDNSGNILALSDAGPDSSTGYMVNGTQVVGPKVAGWTAATGHTIRRGLNIPTAGLTETMDVLATLINDLRSHGLI